MLVMRDIRKSFAGVPANDGISFDVGEGEIHALLGENGAGKTTLMNILYGIYAADSGSIVWRGGELGGHGPKEAIRLGIGMVHQHFMLVPTLSVSENITLGLKSRGHPFPDRRRLDTDIRELSARYGLDVDPVAKVASLSVGERQRVEIMKLLYRDARLLILDEPTAVLTPSETDGLFRVLATCKGQGHSVILITHRISEVLSFADRITVLRDGAKVATLEAAGATPAELSILMIGRELKSPAKRDAAAAMPLHAAAPPLLAAAAAVPSRAAVPPSPSAAQDRAGLEARAISLHPVSGKGLQSVSFSVAPGEIFGIAGVDGNGQKELAECLLGLRIPDSGRLLFGGLPVEGLGPGQRKRRGLAYVSDDRHHDGLVLGFDLAENYLLGKLDDPRFVRFGLVDRKACLRGAAGAIADYHIKTRGPSEEVRLLSGGNQQKLILARELSSGPAIIVAFQPARGLDIGATEFVHERLLERRAAGSSVLLISSDMDELLGLADRIAVLHRGRLSPAYDNDGSLDMMRIGLLMGGQGMAEEACAS
ncbi:MAG: ABC transporter ATP-binding protein [Spirochaetota bacterium]